MAVLITIGAGLVVLVVVLWVAVCREQAIVERARRQFVRAAIEQARGERKATIATIPYVGPAEVDLSAPRRRQQARGQR